MAFDSVNYTGNNVITNQLKFYFCVNYVLFLVSDV